MKLTCHHTFKSWYQNYNFLSTEEIRTIQQQIIEMQEKQDANHAELLALVTPMYKVYNSMQGFGTVIAWVGKFIVTPAIIIIGGLLTYKQLKP